MVVAPRYLIERVVDLNLGVPGSNLAAGDIISLCTHVQ